jgi:NADPH:quinone reductase-like Zn-dependent oxidoreductase
MGNLPRTMHGVQLTGHGGPEKLVYSSQIPVPTPGPGEVLIKVGAAGVNNTDINTRIGWYSKHEGAEEDASWAGGAIPFPRIQGIDVCGSIVAVGDGVDSSRLGERVLIEPCLYEVNGKPLSSPWFLGSECDGGFAEYTRVAARHAHRIESPLSDIELASFPCSYSTAENMLTRSNVRSTDRVLVTGASGGVGSAAVQLCKARGARVHAVTTKAKSDQLRQLGADNIIYREEDLLAQTGTERIDVVIDLVAGKQWPQLLECLKPGGRYAVSGAIAGPIVELDIRTLYLKDLTFYGCTALEPEVFPNLVSHIEKGLIKPLIAKTFPLEDIATAQAEFAEKRHVGKIVLTL